MEEVLLRHFDEWGDIERIKILQSRGVGFVTYFSELSAQFAKEAMMNQSLDGDEVINVRYVPSILLCRINRLQNDLHTGHLPAGRLKIQIQKPRSTNTNV
jgi:RNA recognition motif-containing protein